MSFFRIFTYADSAYLTRCVALLRSVRAFAPTTPVTVLCLDDRTETAIRTLHPEACLLRRSALEEFRPGLREALAPRSLWEQYATCKPVLLHWGLSRGDAADGIAYLDADTCLFSDPRPLLDELAPGSIGLSPHRFPASLESLSIHGRFNAGFLLFRRTGESARCLAEWVDDCVRWCGEKPTAGRFMNQGYLDAWPARYPDVTVLGHAGTNLAPWNVGRHEIVRTNGSVAVDGQPLVLFHFSRLARGTNGRWMTPLIDDAQRNPVLRSAVYGPYVAMLETCERDLRSALGGIEAPSCRASRWDGPYLDVLSGTVLPPDLDLIARVRGAVRRLMGSVLGRRSSGESGRRAD